MKHALLIVVVAILCLSSTVIAQKPSPSSDWINRKTADGRFTIVKWIKRLPVISQGNTGTCWSFATVSFLESEVERMQGKPVDLSEIFPVHYTYLEKAKRFVSTKGKSRFSEGGLCHDVIDVVRKYGIAPQADFNGLCAGDRIHNHGEMAAALSGMIQSLVSNAKKTRHLSKKWEAAVSAMVQSYIGKLPQEFRWGGKKITPKQYADDVLKIPYNDYVTVMSYSSAAFGTKAMLDVPDNWMKYDGYLNVPIKDMLDALDHALTKGYSAAVDMDVSEKGFEAGKGVAYLPQAQEQADITDAMRLKMFKDGSTEDDHLMHIVGLAKDAAGKTWYLTKNSWGKVGPYKGYLFMSRPYMAAKMLSFMVHKGGLPPNIAAVDN